MSNLRVQALIWGGKESNINHYTNVEKELIGYVVRGSMRFISTNGVRELNANDIFIVERCLYRIESENWGDLKVILLEVPLSMFSNGFCRIDVGAKPERLDAVVAQSANFHMQKYFGRVEDRIEYLEKNFISEVAFSKLLKMIFLESTSFSSKVLWYRRLDTTLVVAIEYLQNNMLEGFSLNKLASACGVTISKLNRLFNRYMGMSPLCWASTNKMNYAKNIVVNSEFSTPRVAKMTGYSDTSNFIKRYKREHGKTPFADREVLKVKKTQKK